MAPSQRFLAQIRQYGKIEQQTNIDYSEPVLTLAIAEVDRLTAAGEPLETAVSQVDALLFNEVKRFPVQLPEQHL